MSLIHHWKCQDNAASTAVVAAVGTNGTLIGGDNTSDKSVAGPGTAYPLALGFNGSDDAVDISAAAISIANLTAFTFSCWVYFLATGQRVLGMAAAAESRILTTPGMTRVDVTLSGTGNFTVSSVATVVWHHLLVSRTAANSTRCFMDSVESSSGALTVNGIFRPNVLARSQATYGQIRLADVRVYNSDESANVAAIMAEKDLPGRPRVGSALGQGIGFSAGPRVGLALGQGISL